MKPFVGQIFERLQDAEDFYRRYAKEARFGVRIGPHTDLNGVRRWQRWLCSKQGYRSKKKVDSKPKRIQKISRCGCEAVLAVKLIEDNKFRVEIFVESHTHSLVSPDKVHLIRSNREVNEKAKRALVACHKGGIGTSGAYRYLRISEGGFENVGCNKRDLQNYHKQLRSCITSSDAQMFIDNLASKNELNPTFYYDYVVDEKGRLVHVFWADPTCRKNFSHFGDLLSFDSTYNTNHYNMIFTPFTGINHHKSCVLFGAALLSNETTEAYTWLFRTFLRAMGGVAPRLIITDEANSMRNAISIVFPSSTHRLCMWHILQKLPAKLPPQMRENKLLYQRINLCVWASETREEFEHQWASIISEFGLQGHDWLRTRYEIRASWVPVFFRHVFLAGILNTTSRSESTNSFFNRFIGYKNTLVEFWIRFVNAMDEQRHQELENDNASLHTSPVLQTSWALERHGSEVFTFNVFSELQKQIINARDNCVIETIVSEGDYKISTVNDERKKMREFRVNITTNDGHCTCMFFEMYGIPCCHLIRVLQCPSLKNITDQFNLKRWTKLVTKDDVFDGEGNMLKEVPKDAVETTNAKLASQIRSKIEELIYRDEGSNNGLQTLRDSIVAFGEDLSILLPERMTSQVQEIESFIGCSIPNHVIIQPPNEVKSVGRCKRTKPG